MTHPLFRYFNRYRQSAESQLLNPHASRIKRYPGARVVTLPEPEVCEVAYATMVHKRSSCRDFAGTSLTLDALSSVLYWGMAHAATEQSSGAQSATDADPVAADTIRRPYPSGGAKYPVEAYVITDTHDELGSGAYHYRPDTHILEQVSDCSEDEMTTLKQSYGYNFVRPVPVCIIFTYIMERNVPKYGTFGGKLALIESGHIAQNMCLVAAAQDIGALPLGGGDFAYIETLLGLDGYNESAFYTLALGAHR